jgi:hypothetical protein
MLSNNGKTDWRRGEKAMSKPKRKRGASPRSDVRSGAGDVPREASNYCSDCGRNLNESGGGNCPTCEQVEAGSHDWRDEHPFPDSCFEGRD